MGSFTAARDVLVAPITSDPYEKCGLGVLMDEINNWQGAAMSRILSSRLSPLHSSNSSTGRCTSQLSAVMRRTVQVLIASLLPVMAWAGPIDINKADAATIAKELNGIGLNKAQAIVAYREKNGNFKTLEDLRKVKGIGVKTLERNRTNIRLDGAAPK
jgi:competence protein ComEA